MKKIFLLLTITLLTINLFSQTIDPSRRVLWSDAGNFNNNPVITNIISIVNYGGAGDGVTDNSAAIVSAINSLGGHAGVISFPPGNFLCRDRISLPDSIIIRGDCSDSTNFIFHLGSTGYDCIDVTGNVNTAFQSIV